jgi:hypothetical protein
MKSLAAAIQRYEDLIQKLAEDFGHHFRAIGDPNFEGVRFYAFANLTGRFSHNEATELAAGAVDEIEGCLVRFEHPYTLLAPMLAKLRSVAPVYNANHKTVFMGSWGMGPGEIGWMIRFINDRETFERYLQSAGISEEAVDAYNEAFERASKTGALAP